MSDYKHFNLSEFRCSHCGQNRIKHDFVTRLDELRELAGFPFVVTSGWRCKEHPSEATKEFPGQHFFGVAADIKVSNGSERRRIVDCALEMGFRGIGVANGFVHVDDREGLPVMWTYGT